MTHLVAEKSAKITREKRDEIRKDFEEFILKSDHPCIMAQAVFNAKNYTLNCYKDFGSTAAAKRILADIKEFLTEYDFENNQIESFIAVFSETDKFTEERFEELLWKQLIEINKYDSKEWDPEVSSNPEDKNFSFSIAGKAFFVIGMHPNSSRLSRQSPHTAIVFNLHHQFENLRKRGVFKDVRQRIRKRDMKLQGSTNHMVKDFGIQSEAMQYSGRAVDDSWKCPFHPKKNE